MTHTFGAKFGPKDVRDYKAVCAIAKDDFPKEFTLWKSDAKDQGMVDACVAHVIASVFEFFNHIQEGTDIKFSTDWNYGNRTDYTGKGMFIDDALKNAVSHGGCPLELLPGNHEVPTVIDIFKEHKVDLFDEAYPHRISKFFVVDGESIMKMTLMQYGPIVIGVNWHEGTDVDEDGILHFNIKTKSVGGHCMYIYGWNELGWKVANSWGLEWGHDGNCIIPFDEPIRASYGVVDNNYIGKSKDSTINSLRGEVTQLKLKNMSIQDEVNNKANQILELSNKISDLSLEIFNLEAKLNETGAEKDKINEELGNVRKKINEHIAEIQLLKAQVEQDNKQKAEYKTQLEEYEKTINGLKEELIEIKEPFKSPIGKIVAKILNWFIKLFSKKEG